MKKSAIIVGIMITLITAFPLKDSVIEHKTKTKPKPIAKHATMVQKKANKAMAKQYALAGWGWGKVEWACANKLFTNESRFDHLATNKHSSAFGIAQHLKEKSKEPSIQLLHAYRYIAHRYQTPCRAWKFHLRHNYY